MNRKHRLNRSEDFKRVRRFGKTYAHPLVVLFTQPAASPTLRVGVAATKALGGAVQRNRARRRMREVVRPLLPALQPGWDLVLLARPPLAQASFSDLQNAVRSLLDRARLWKVQDDAS